MLPDIDIWTAMGQQVRRDIYDALLADGTSEARAVRSPTWMADQLGIPLPNVSYHVRVMVEAGLLTLIEQVRVRGVVKSLYALTAEVGAGASELPQPLPPVLPSARPGI